MKNRKKIAKKNSKKNFRRQKIESCKSSEMRFAEVSRRSERSTEPTEPIFGRTDLRKGVSEAKFDVEADFDVEKSKIGPKSAENHEKP